MAVAPRARGGRARPPRRAAGHRADDMTDQAAAADGTKAERGLDRLGGRGGGLAAIQRARMVAAMAEVARERGVGQVTVADVVARSGVSRRTFYELFEHRDACFLAAFDEAVERAQARVLPAYASGGSWRERVRAGLGALLEFLEDEPVLGRLCIVDALGGGPVALEHRARVLEATIDVIDQGCAEAKGSTQPTRLTAEGVVGAVLAVLHARLSVGESTARGARRGSTAQAGNASISARLASGSQRREDGATPMTGLLGALMGMIVLPYQGPAAAAREASRPAPSRRRSAKRHGDPLRDLDMRLTYRTVRVLLAIAANPGASNRQVADAAGVADQGQISKLLARLEHLGLIRNDWKGGPTRGEPNAWTLTPKGQEIEDTIRRQATPAGA
jgi:AcrR family transcriptional regulator